MIPTGASYPCLIFPSQKFKITSIPKVMSAVQLIGNKALSSPYLILVPEEPVIG